jgi:hypothetical protein
LALLELLLDQSKIDPEVAEYTFGNTAMHVAALQGRTDLVRALLYNKCR